MRFPIDQSMWPAHLRDDAPTAVCDNCGRRTVAMEEFGKTCVMTQPNRKPCGGTFSDPGDISRLLSDLERLRARVAELEPVVKAARAWRAWIKTIHPDIGMFIPENELMAAVDAQSTSDGAA